MKVKMDVLTGQRVIEFCTAAVGPLVGEFLALMGAEVIKVESRRKLDILRLRQEIKEGTRLGVNAVPVFNDVNLNKKGICLNLSTPKGLELAKRLIQISDVVVENFAAGVIERFGLSYEVVKEIKPDIVMISASAVGHTGPRVEVPGVAPAFAGLSGLGEMTGYPDEPPAPGRISMDFVNGYMACFAVLAALWHRQETGQGQYVDYSDSEGISCLIGESFMDYTMNDREQTRNGNRDNIMAPHNCYRCQGEDSWVSIAISDEAEWKAFCEAIGNPDWTEDESFCDAYSRWHNQEKLDKLVEQWTTKHTKYEVMDILQKVGVAAVPSFTSADLYTNPHLAARQFTEVIEHPEIGATVVLRFPAKLSLTQPQIVRHAPLLGEHNEYVFGELLGLSRDEIADLEESKVLW